LENAILVGKDSTSGWKFEISLPEALNFPGERQTSSVVEIIIFRAEDVILSTWEKFSTSVLRMPFIVRMFRLLARQLVLNLD
jgi:hypothetical protein